MKILYLIPARGGSKGVPGKNMKELDGKPLIAYSIDMAKRMMSEGNAICVSTDSSEISEFAKSLGVEPPFLRPAALATDTAGTYEVILHAINFYETQGISFDSVMLLQPTSPFREEWHIIEVIDLMNSQSELEMVVSVRESKDNPYFNLFEENSEGYLRLSKYSNYIRRQDCPKIYAYNGSIYLMKVDALKKRAIHQFRNIAKYVMNEKYSIDIDDMKDWLISDLIIKKKIY